MVKNAGIGYFQIPAFFRRPFSSLNIFGMKGLCPLCILPADPVPWDIYIMQ